MVKSGVNTGLIMESVLYCYMVSINVIVKQDSVGSGNGGFTNDY